MSYRPTRAVANAARQGLRVRAQAPPSRQGGTDVGTTRGEQLAGRRRVSLDTVRRMLRYFVRHLKDKQGSTWDERGKGWQAWHLWGGDPGARWAARIVRRDDPAYWAQFLEGADNRALLRHLGLSTRRA